MTPFWRICRSRYATEALSGLGARLYGGRWNSPGLSVVYASTSLALAAVETFVNIEPGAAPNDLVAIRGEIPEGLRIGRVAESSLDRRWRSQASGQSRRLGDAWIQMGETVALLVPSAAIEGEWNLLLNPAHPDFGSIVSAKAKPFRFDRRMFTVR